MFKYFLSNILICQLVKDHYKYYWEKLKSHIGGTPRITSQFCDDELGPNFNKYVKSNNKKSA